MRNPLLIPDLREIIRDGQAADLVDFFADYNPPRIAEMLEDFEPSEQTEILALLEQRKRGEVFSYLDLDTQVHLAETLPTDVIASLLQWMPHDDRAKLAYQLEEEQVDQILRQLAQAEREDIRRLLSYEPGTAGAVMTTDYAALPPQISVREAIARLRQEAPDRETIDYAYVIDAHRKPLGLVSLKQLILARPSVRMEEIMNRDVILGHVDEDQEEIARKIEKYDLYALPIVDERDHMVGIVTHDDAMDILRQEQGESILAFGGVGGQASDQLNSDYWRTGIGSSVRRRLTWLLPLFLSGTMTGWVLDRFEWVDKLIPALAVFVPLLIGTGGNAGSQAVGTIIRALALGEVQFADALKVLIREWFTGLFLGILLGSLGFLFAWIGLGTSPRFALVISLTILGICVWANVVGSMVPLVATRLGIDPAIVSAPLISTLVDVTGLVIYYLIAIIVLVNVL
ncbi:MAG: magnesium transporter [Planctomycetota bacterium]|nr:magnesium transporter [Planctomycetota bacterium]